MNYYNYFTEIEDHFVRRRGKHLLVSPMDWSLIAAWRESGVPLHIALRGIDKAMDNYQAKRRWPGRIHSLFYCHESVMEEYAVHLDARIGEAGRSEETASAADASVAGGPDREALLGFLDERVSEIKRLLEKHSDGKELSFRIGIERILIRLGELRAATEAEPRTAFEALERDLGILDEDLVHELRSAVPSEESAKWEEFAKSELKVYKKKLPKETYQKILENYRRSRIHQFFQIGELSLFHL